MRRSFRQATDRLYQLFPAQFAHFYQSFSLHQFREQRSAGHSGNASLGQKANLGDPAVRNPQSQLQDVSAGRIFELDGCVGIGDLTSIARVLKMIEKLGRIHLKIVTVSSQRGFGPIWTAESLP